MSLFIPHPVVITTPKATFEDMTFILGRKLIEAPQVNTGHWQAMKGVPQTQTRELRGVVMTYPIPETEQELFGEILPSDPWAEHQFKERVQGEPLNPGVTYTEWPWFKGNVPEHQDEAEKFSHTYMERYWPRYVQPVDSSYTGHERQGIRYRYGDLDDVVNLLWKEPTTRQAYLPVWFPEDTGATADQRVPCSLGYHFMMREGKLHVLYPIRSCDFLRHFKDDVYLTARLVQEVLERLKDKDHDASPDEFNQDMSTWASVVPGDLEMVMHSLHVFEGDMPKMRRDYGYVAA